MQWLFQLNTMTLTLRMESILHTSHAYTAFLGNYRSVVRICSSLLRTALDYYFHLTFKRFSAIVPWQFCVFLVFVLIDICCCCCCCRCTWSVSVVVVGLVTSVVVAVVVAINHLCSLFRKMLKNIEQRALVHTHISYFPTISYSILSVNDVWVPPNKNGLTLIWCMTKYDSKSFCFNRVYFE